MAPALPHLSAREAVAALERAGFVFVSQRGSHRKYRHPQTRRRCVVPMHATLATGTLASILRQAGLSSEEFATHLRRGRSPKERSEPTDITSRLPTGRPRKPGGDLP